MNELNLNGKPNSNHNPKEILIRYLPFLPWIILSVLLALTIAFLILRYATPIYEVKGKVLVKQKNPYGDSKEKFGSILMLPEANTNLNNEIEILKSSSLALRTIKRLGLQISYSIKGNIRTSEAHISDMPFRAVIDRVADSTKSYTFTVLPQDPTRFKLNESPTVYHFNQHVILPEISFYLIPTYATLLTSANENQYIFSWQPEDKLSLSLAKSINVLRSEGADVLNISLSTQNSKNGVDIINQYMNEYRLASMEDKKQIALYTAEFIDEQLDTIQRELGGVEQNLQRFREENKIFDVEGQSQLVFSELTDANKLLTEQQVKLRILDYLLNYISNPKNAAKLVPSNLGIEEPSLVEQITAYNKMQLEKETMLKTTQPENPMVLNLETGIQKIREDITQNLQNVRQAYNLSINELSKKINSAGAGIESIPRKEKAMLEVTRRQNILQELYSFLLQKKLETAISSASTISDIKILEPAVPNNTPISPNKKSTYMFAFLIGLGLPVGIIMLRDYLNDKVQTKQDIVKATETPVLGELGHVEDAITLVVKQNERSYIAEQFRIIRSNLQYILPKQEKPVILITSSFSGEGKSFVSTNLTAVLSLSGKKTVVMEMDIRKPKIMQGLGMHARKGFSNYMIGNISVDEIIYEVPEVDNMYVIPCGPVPPNPGEMLLDAKLGELFKSLKERFDAIIIDSAPVGMVSDAIALAAYANASVYIVRHNYTLKKQLELIDSIYKQKKIPRPSIVINDINSSRGGYGNYYGYGYGYGYGLGSSKKHNNGYFETTAKRKNKIVKRLRQWFSKQ